MQVALEKASQEAVHLLKAKRLRLYHTCLRIVGAGREIADGLAQDNGMLTQHSSHINAGLPQLWTETSQSDAGLLRCSWRLENEGSPEYVSP